MRNMLVCLKKKGNCEWKGSEEDHLTKPPTSATKAAFEEADRSRSTSSVSGWECENMSFPAQLEVSAVTFPPKQGLSNPAHPPWFIRRGVGGNSRSHRSDFRGTDSSGIWLFGIKNISCKTHPCNLYSASFIVWLGYGIFTISWHHGIPLVSVRHFDHWWGPIFTLTVKKKVFIQTLSKMEKGEENTTVVKLRPLMAKSYSFTNRPACLSKLGAAGSYPKKWQGKQTAG